MDVALNGAVGVMMAAGELPSKVHGDRSPTRDELSRWNDLLRHLDRAQKTHARAFALLANVAIAANYCASRGIVVPFFGTMPDLEQRLFAVGNELDKITRLVRDVEDGVLGARYVNGDFDIIQPSSPSNLQGFFIPVLLGLVALAGVISRLIWVERENNELSDNYNEILAATDKTLCADPGSTTCIDWKKTKSEKAYVENKTLADTLRDAAASTGRGLGMGLMIAIPLIAWSWFGRNRK